MKLTNFRSRLILGISAVIFLVLSTLLMSTSLGPVLSNLARVAYENLTARVISVTTPGPVIVEELKALNKLETVRQTCRHVVQAKSDSLPLPQFLVKDKLLMLVQTEVVAGIDMSRISEKDVQYKDKKLIIRLPEPEIFSVRINDRGSRVYNRERGWLVLNPNTELEREARLKALSDARSTAARSEVLVTAKANAEKNLKALLESLGFDKVSFKWYNHMLSEL